MKEEIEVLTCLLFVRLLSSRLLKIFLARRGNLKMIWSIFKSAFPEIKQYNIKVSEQFLRVIIMIHDISVLCWALLYTACYCSARISTAQHGSARLSTAQHGSARLIWLRTAALHGTAQHSSAKLRTAQHDSLQLGTAQLWLCLSWSKTKNCSWYDINPNLEKLSLEINTNLNRSHHLKYKLQSRKKR